MKKIFACAWLTNTERNFGYLILRVFAGAALMTHGVPKLLAGPDQWVNLGRTVTSIGIPGPAVFWGFMAAFAESVGAGLLLVGFLSRAAAFLIVVNMIVAAFVAHAGDPFARRELALLYLAISLLFMLKGAGSFAIDRLLPHSRG